MTKIGKYRVISKIASGGMGAVYLAHDDAIGRDVAIKVIHEQFVDSEEFLARFKREARSAGRLSHPNITVIYEIGEDDGSPFMAMEYLQGTDLTDLIRARTALSLDKKLDIAIQTCRGLHEAHENGVVHRDIKPGNIRVLDTGVVKIMDFGIARIQETSQLTNVNSQFGTPRYMAPEHIRGEHLNRQADIFSFGVVFYELLSGVNPFAGEHIGTVMNNILNNPPAPLAVEPDSVSKHIAPVLTKCLEKGLDDRYNTLKEVAVDLDRIRRMDDETMVMSVVDRRTLIDAAQKDESPVPDVTVPVRGQRAALPRADDVANKLSDKSTAHEAKQIPVGQTLDSVAPTRRPHVAIIGVGVLLICIAAAVGYFVIGLPDGPADQPSLAAVLPDPGASLNVSDTDPSMENDTSPPAQSLDSNANPVVDSSDDATATVEPSSEAETVEAQARADRVWESANEARNSVRATLHAEPTFLEADARRARGLTAYRAGDHERAIGHFDASRQSYERIAAAAGGIMEIKSEPSDAEVVVDGILVGRTPMKLNNIAVGLRTFEIRAEGYKSYTEQVSVVRDREDNRTIRLVRASPTLSVGKIVVSSAPSGAEVFVAGKSRGTTPLSIDDAPVGQLDLVFRKTGFADATYAATVTADNTTQVTQALEQLMGVVKIRVNPWGAVFLDGQQAFSEVDQAFKSIEVAAGVKHRLEVNNPEYGRCTLWTDVAAEKTTELYVNFSQSANVPVVAVDADTNSPIGGAQILVNNERIGDITPGPVKFIVGCSYDVALEIEGYKTSVPERVTIAKGNGTIKIPLAAVK